MDKHMETFRSFLESENQGKFTRKPKGDDVLGKGKEIRAHVAKGTKRAGHRQEQSKP